MRKAKSEFYVNKIDDCSKSKDINKSWSLINSLLGKKGKSTYINKLNINDYCVNDPKLIAESI